MSKVLLKYCKSQLLSVEERAELKARAMNTPYLDKMLKIGAVKFFRNKD